MTAAARRHGGTGVLAAVSRLLIEPAGGEPTAWQAPPIAIRQVIAVGGLRRGVGTTTVARALAVELALRDTEGVAVATAASVRERGIPLGTAAATRLSRALVRTVPTRTSAAGRLCLVEAPVHECGAVADRVRGMAPVVVDVTEPTALAGVVSVADAVVLVGAPDLEPALAAVLAESLRRLGPEPVVVVNRDAGEGTAKWEGCGAVGLPESRMGARLASVGREPHGLLALAITELADRLA